VAQVVNSLRVGPANARSTTSPEVKRFGAVREHRGGVWERLIADATTVPLHDELLDYESRREADRAKLNAMVRYCRTAQCRTRQLLDYFGEEPAADYECGHCDNDRAGAGE
jgi:ATP-dependent DNA helicase RecQ